MLAIRHADERGLVIVSLEAGSDGLAHLEALARLIEDPRCTLPVIALTDDVSESGSEQALAAGAVDAFSAAGIRAFGPSQQAAELEASKVFCKNLLRHADVAQAEFRTFTDGDSALTHLNAREDTPVVVKADGLAAGKGVIVCDNREQAIDAVNRIASSRALAYAV